MHHINWQRNDISSVLLRRLLAGLVEVFFMFGSGVSAMFGPGVFAMFGSGVIFASFFPSLPWVSSRWPPWIGDGIGTRLGLWGLHFGHMQTAFVMHTSSS